MADSNSEPRGPAFVRYFGPVIESLRHLGGSARPAEVTNLVADRCEVSSEDLDHQLSSGVSRFKNQVAWARFYLVKSGYIDSSLRGVWTLTEKGLSAELSHEEALSVFKSVQSQFGNTRSSDRDECDDALDNCEVSEQPDNHRELLLEILRGLSPGGFERLCQRLLREAGFEQVTVTGRTGDGGIDGHGVLRLNAFVSFNVLFQCKRYSGTVSPSTIRDFRGAMMGRTDKGIILTTGNFSSEARKEANRDGAPPLELVDGDGLLDLFEQFELGVHPVTRFEVDTSFFAPYQDD
jgi:restriction system protein